MIDKKTFLMFSFSMLLTFSCGNDDTEEKMVDNTISVEEGRRIQVANLYDNNIVILQQQHIDLLDILMAESEHFISNPTRSSLSNLKEVWRSAFLHWKTAEIYSLGAIQSSFIHTRIHQWPVNFDAIETNIINEVVINEDFVSSTGANVKGYGALEYLLFHSAEAAILSEFTTAENADRRLQYLKSLVSNLREQSDLLRIFWNDIEDNFKANLETGVSGIQNQVVNALIAGLETIKGRKIEEALNAESTALEQLEAFQSEQSKNAIAANLNAIYSTYLGDFDANNDFGLEEYIIEVLNRPDIDLALKEAFESAFSDLDAMDDSLENTIILNVDLVENFRISIQEIIGIFKSDFSSAASIVVTFNDNDGD